MRVGELARRTGTTVRALRYYESAGLVVPRRLGNGYREYDPIAVRLVRQIRELTALGLSVDQTRPFVQALAAGEDEAEVCAAAVATYQNAVSGLRDRIARLSAQRETLEERIDASVQRAAVNDPCALVGRPLPPLSFYATDGTPVDLGAGRSVVFVYPLTGSPAVDLRDGRLEIAGAGGQSSWVRDQHGELLRAGATRVYGLSAQPHAYQRELVHRLGLPYPLIPDPRLSLADSLGLPTFTTAGTARYRRLTLVVADNVVEHVFHPIAQPATHALQVMRWLARRKDVR
jgi:DNA-binding transcriptional MerR regulator